MELILGVIGLVVILSKCLHEKVEDINYEEFKRQRDSRGPEFVAQHSNVDYEIMLEQVIPNRVFKNSPGYDPEVSEYFRGELSKIVSGTKYWKQLADPAEDLEYAICILLAARGYFRTRYAHSEPIDGAGARIYEHLYFLRLRPHWQKYSTEACIELFEITEDLLHKNGVPYGWMLYRDRGQQVMLWGGSDLHPGGRFRPVSLAEVKQVLQELEERNKHC